MGDNIVGLGDLRAKFRELKNVDRGARVAVVAGGRILKTEAKARALAHGLRRTGAMIANIVIKRDRGSPGTVRYHLGVRHGRALPRKAKADSKYLAVNNDGRVVTRYENNPYYWRYHEFGTSKMPARPFLGPALEARRADVIEAMTTAVLKEIEKQARV